MTKFYGRFRLLVVMFAMVALGVGAVIASQAFNPDSMPMAHAQGDGGNNTQSHEGCDVGPIFDYSQSLDELEFGASVNCTSNTMIYINIYAYLYKKNNDGEWQHILTVRKACYVSKTCAAERTIDSPSHGDYYLYYCFNARSIGSDWPFACFDIETSIP